MPHPSSPIVHNNQPDVCGLCYKKTAMPELHVVGDTHGHLNELRRLLRAVQIIDADDNWLASQDTLVLLGDMVDRGPDGVGVIDLLTQIQEDARAHGGQVHAVLGNHEVQLLAARQFGDTARAPESTHTFFGDWHRWGGVLEDLARLQPRHVHWLEQLPTVVRIGDDLLVHADATFYPRYGRSVDEVNATVADVLASVDVARWDALLRDMLEKHAFEGDSGAQFLGGMLARFGGRRLIHGHSPICHVLGQPPDSISRAHVYAGGRCVNVDHGVYLGGRGFVFTTTISTSATTGGGVLTK